MGLSAAVHFVVLLAPAVLLLAVCVDLLVFFHSHQDASGPLYLERGDGGNAGSGAT